MFVQPVVRITGKFTGGKNLNLGDFLIDDRKNNGVDEFRGEHIHFGSARYPDWPLVVKYLRERII